MTKKELFEALKDVDDDEPIQVLEEQWNETSQILRVDTNEDDTFLVLEPEPKL